ncbi:Hypothetical protein NTJ_00446 [Nesidiocoris tenuis]|uniref:Uncharacterized protein n=1 Tax=Nesidiocoris tenuis TaxID=355587 RepID=A0ABN7A5Y7_9HEMI|nr:Hypothetical protein NTJ_00446 [Nesidiocoris tenuis]
MTTPELVGPNSGYGSGDETSTLLAKAAKPVLMRQDCTTTLIVSPTPHLSASGGLMGASDESGVLPQQDEGARSVPDIEMHCRTRGPNHLVPHRCYCVTERRKSQSMARSVSRESVRSGHPPGPPPVLLTTTPNSRIIRQSSQPEACHCCPYHPAPSSSLRQLREPGDGIAGIAADSLRINGAIRQFKQGILLNPNTLAQQRRARLRRAFTDATSETVTIVKTVLFVQ